MREKAGRREVRYYLLNAAKPPFDDINARKAVAYALDTDQINEIRNDSQLQVADQAVRHQGAGPSREARLPEAQPRQGEADGDGLQGGARRAVQRA